MSECIYLVIRLFCFSLEMTKDIQLTQNIHYADITACMRWLGHVLRMENSRLPRKFLLSKPEIGWKRSRGGQVMTWHREMKEATRKLAAVGQCRLPGWGPRESAHKWLSTLEDMARDRCQWRSCCNFLIDLHDS